MPQAPIPVSDERTLSATESVLLVAGGPVSLSSLAGAVGVQRNDIDGIIRELTKRFTGGIRLQVHDEQAQLITAPENAEAIHRFLGTSRPPSLSRSALEALATVAYRQPVTRAEVEAARGVNSDRAVQTLLARGLIEEQGRRAAPGHPVQYGTTFTFLEYFGLSSLGDLPPFASAGEEPANPAEFGLKS